MESKLTQPLKIYIAGPYSAETAEQRLKNVLTAIDVGIALYSRGHFPYVPHLTHFIDERANAIGTPMSWEDFIKWDMPWVAACDALLYLKNSRGADLELRAAKKLGKKIFYSLEEVDAVKASDEQTETASYVLS